MGVCLYASTRTVSARFLGLTVVLNFHVCVECVRVAAYIARACLQLVGGGIVCRMLVFLFVDLQV